MQGILSKGHFNWIVLQMSFLCGGAWSQTPLMKMVSVFFSDYKNKSKYNLWRTLLSNLGLKTAPGVSQLDYCQIKSVPGPSQNLTLTPPLTLNEPKKLTLT